MECKKKLKDLTYPDKKETEKLLEKGYIAMGEINLSLAEEGIYADNEQLLTYEQKLSERE
jgi:hypothetical protein